MILTVTLNAAVDKTYRIEGFCLDRVHRPTEWRVSAGGKGINVARVYTALGGKAVATGFLGGYNGRFIERSLRQEGIEGDFVYTRAELRVCIAAVDPIALTQTEINETGPLVNARQVALLKRTVSRLLKERTFSYLALCGSLPPGATDSIYAELIETARTVGVRCALDASCEALRLGAAARPWLLKPNLFELAQLTGYIDYKRGDWAGIERIARSLLGTGTELVVVTLGSQGVLAVNARSAWVAGPPDVRFVSAVGSGDSFLAGLLWSLNQWPPLADALRTATAAGAANAAQYGAGFIEADEVARLERLVRIDRLQ